MQLRSFDPTGVVWVWLQRLELASVLQAGGFRGDITVFRLNAGARPKTGSECAFRRNEAERVYIIEAAHNPEVAVRLSPQVAPTGSTVLQFGW
jgi:hypothetical protein